MLLRGKLSTLLKLEDDSDGSLTESFMGHLIVLHVKPKPCKLLTQSITLVGLKGSCCILYTEDFTFSLINLRLRVLGTLELSVLFQEPL